MKYSSKLFSKFCEDIRTHHLERFGLIQEGKDFDKEKIKEFKSIERRFYKSKRENGFGSKEFEDCVMTLKEELSRII